MFNFFNLVIFIYLILHCLSMLLNAILYMKSISVLKKEDETSWEFFERDNSASSLLLLIILLCILPLFTFAVNYSMYELIEKEKTKKREKSEEYKTELSLKIAKENLNNLYQCSECNLMSRQYQSSKGKHFAFHGDCPHCSAENSLLAFENEKAYEMEDIPFAEKIQEKHIDSYIEETYSKWEELERKESEFRDMKYKTEVKIQQLSAYEKLKKENLDDKLSSYEERLKENIEEMEKFKEDLISHYK